MVGNGAGRLRLEGPCDGVAIGCGDSSMSGARGERPRAGKVSASLSETGVSAGSATGSTSAMDGFRRIDRNHPARGANSASLRERAVGTGQKMAAVPVCFVPVCFVEGDAINIVLAAAGSNLRKLLGRLCCALRD